MYIIIFFLTSSKTSEIFISVSSGRSLNIGTLKTLHKYERNRLLLVGNTTVTVGEMGRLKSKILPLEEIGIFRLPYETSPHHNCLEALSFDRP